MKNLTDYHNLLGLIGYPLSHSFSKGYFAQKFKKEGIDGFFYESFPIPEINEFPLLFVKYPNLKGLNVTIPYKEQVISYLDELDADAATIGAVNTIKKLQDGRLKGYNTDVYGFRSSLHNKIKRSNLNIKRALVLGTGGAAKAVHFSLKKLNISYQEVSRKKENGDLCYQELNAELFSNIQLVVNTTPLGMSPNTKSYPELPYDALSDKHLLYDLVYNPEKTIFLQKGEDAGAAIINGLEMLHLQAEKAWEIWNS